MNAPDVKPQIRKLVNYVGTQNGSRRETEGQCAALIVLSTMVTMLTITTLTTKRVVMACLMLI